MKPLLHPAVEDITVEGILQALSNPVQASIYAEIVAAEGSQNCSTFLQVSAETIPKSTFFQHCKALREAGLIRTERLGLEIQNSSRDAEIEKRFPGLILGIVNAHKLQVEREARSSHAGKKKLSPTK